MEMGMISRTPSVCFYSSLISLFLISLYLWVWEEKEWKGNWEKHKRELLTTLVRISVVALPGKSIYRPVTSENS